MKKVIKYFAIACVASGFALASCNDDYMQRDPINTMADGSFLKTVDELPIYLNQFYNIYGTGHQSGNAYSFTPPFYITRGSQHVYGDLFTDNAVGFTGTGGDLTNRMQGTWQVPATAATSLDDGNNTGWRWGNLRSINYFIRQAKMIQTDNPAVLNGWLAEAYFFKAFDYYWKLAAFGEVPWLEEDLTTESPELYSPRTPRAELVDKMLECLDFAVENLTSDSGPAHGRINKSMANFLKARICLFEATFRKYHTELGLQASVNGLLDECVEACEAIVATGAYDLFTTPSGLNIYNAKDSYWNMFKQNGLEGANHKEAIFARVYDAAKSGHATGRYNAMNRGNAAGRYSKGATKDLVDDYLCVDGLPIGTSPLFKGYDGDDWRELDNRDPRLKQTVVKPGEYITIHNRDENGGAIDQATQGLKYPEITFNCPTANQVPIMGPSITGYMFIKHWTNEPVDNQSTTSGSLTALMFRYAEVLLMLAEAKAELGTITDADLDLTVNALRTRAGFDFTAYPNAKLTLGNIPADTRLDQLNAQYLGYSVSPILREIRRERRVEMAWEGLRREDLYRWKAGKFIEKPNRGMKFTAEKQTLYDGTNTLKPKNAAAAKLNVDVFVDGEGFIIAYPRSPNVTNGVVKWDDRYYYNPIPLQELELNKELTQSPGWQDVARN